MAILGSFPMTLVLVITVHLFVISVMFAVTERIADVSHFFEPVYI